jgi:hypothetical protein
MGDEKGDEKGGVLKLAWVWTQLGRLGTYQLSQAPCCQCTLRKISPSVFGGHLIMCLNIIAMTFRV